MVEVILWAIFAAVLIYAAVSDIRTLEIPDLVPIALLIISILHILSGYSLKNSIFGFLIGLLPLTISLLFHDSLCGGDLKLIFCGGFFLGWQQSFAVLFLSMIFFAIITTIILKIKHKSIKNTAMPYGPYYAGLGIAIFFIKLIGGSF